MELMKTSDEELHFELLVVLDSGKLEDDCGTNPVRRPDDKHVRHVVKWFAFLENFRNSWFFLIVRS